MSYAVGGDGGPGALQVASEVLEEGHLLVEGLRVAG